MIYVRMPAHGCNNNNDHAHSPDFLVKEAASYGSVVLHCGQESFGCRNLTKKAVRFACTSTLGPFSDKS